MENLNWPYYTKEVESIVQTFPRRFLEKTPRIDVMTRKFYHHLREK